MTERIVISKSAKKKMSSVFEYADEVNGKTIMVRVYRDKANDFTEQVVYKTKLPNGKYISQTRHEKIA